MKVATRIKKLLGLNDEHDLLAAWDVQFLASIRDQAQTRSLSTRQNDILQKIEAKLSSTKIAEAREWTQCWDEAKADTAQTIAQYYSGSGYFSALSRQILTDPTYIPSKKAYEKMCENKYAKRVLEIAAAEPAYAEGSTVMLRTTAKNTLSFAKFNKLKECPLFVLKVLPQIESAAKGAKLYEILSGRSCEVFRIEERFLKSYRKPKHAQAV
jgi:hypothetical protein